MFCVQPYVVKKQRLRACGAAVFCDQADAMAAASTLRRRHAGIVVLAQDTDPTSGWLGRPQLLFRHGDVPACWSDVTRPARAA